MALASVTFKACLSVSSVWGSQGSTQANIIWRVDAEGCRRQIRKEQKNGDPEGRFLPPFCGNLLNQDQFGLALLFPDQQHALKAKLPNCDCLTSVSAAGVKDPFFFFFFSELKLWIQHTHPAGGEVEQSRLRACTAQSGALKVSKV